VGIAIMLIGTVLLIFDLVVSRRAGFIVAGMTLLVVIILAVLPWALRANRRPAHSPEAQTKIS
jgi:tetrahydromethanopterin S-methyltransferase subunit E